MESLAKEIAANPLLQAISIIVAIVTAIIFLYKNLRAISTFFSVWMQRGLRAALIRSIRPAVRRAKFSWFDVRLIILELTFLTIRATLRFAIVPMMYLILLVFIQIAQDFDDKVDKSIPTITEFVIIVLISGPISMAMTYFIFSPIYTIWYYLQICRRRIIRSLRRGADETGFG